MHRQGRCAFRRYGCARSHSTSASGQRSMLADRRSFWPIFHGSAAWRGSTARCGLTSAVAVVRDTAEFCCERACLLRIVEFDAQRVPIFNALIGAANRRLAVARRPAGARSRRPAAAGALSEALEEPGSAETQPPAVERRLIASIGLAIESRARAEKSRQWKRTRTCDGAGRRALHVVSHRRRYRP